MKKNLCLYSAILLLIGSNYSTFISAAASTQTSINNNSKIKLDYLNQLPKNDYILGAGDSFLVKISRELPELQTFVTIDGEGTIYLPRLKRIYVKGLSINELSTVLDKAYKKFVKYPSTEVLMVNYRPIRILVEGEVSNPGMHILEGSMSTIQSRYFLLRDQINKNQLLNNNNSLNVNEFLNSNITEVNSDDILSNENSLNPNVNSKINYFPTVFDAIRASGGITQYSNLSEVRLIRKNNLSKGSGKITTILNLEKLLEVGDNSHNIRIYDSDIIKIKKTNNPNKALLTRGILSNLNPRYIKVFVAGRVKTPGTITVSRASTLSDAIDVSGGAKAVRGPLTFIRFNNDGTIDKRKFKYRRNSTRGSYKNPNLKNGDLIVMEQNFLSAASEIITDFTSPFVGIYSTYGLIKAIED